MAPSAERRGHAWLHRDLHGHRVAVGEGWIGFADHDVGATPLVVLGGLVAFPLAWAALERAAGAVSASLARGPLPGALTVAATLALASAWRARRKRALYADPRGARGSLTFDAARGVLVERARDGERVVARRDEISLRVTDPNANVHGFSGTYALVVEGPAFARTVAEASARADLDALARDLQARGLGALAEPSS